MPTSTVATDTPAAKGPLRSCGRCGATYRTDFQRCPTDGTELISSAIDPLVGTVLGEQYAIEELIGEGAMGRVYRAHHALLTNKRYAVKVLVGDLAVSSASRMRFAREAEAASRLEHPAIVGVHDFGRSATGLLYIVMELVEGETLRRVLSRGPMAPLRVEKLARQLCEGLVHAHMRGVVHRDLKPDNILVTNNASGELARIADFGLALTHEDDTRLTQSGIVCTPAYAAPEQLMGGAIDHRADLYALGVTLYEMLSGGTMPFADDAGAKLLEDAPSVALISPTAPATLVKTIGKLLERDPAKRPASALDVVTQLDAGALEATAPLEAIPATPPARRRMSTQGLAAKLGEMAQKRITGKLALAAARLVELPPIESAPRARLLKGALLVSVAGFSGALAFAAITHTRASAEPAAALVDPQLHDEPSMAVHVAAPDGAPPAGRMATTAAATPRLAVAPPPIVTLERTDAMPLAPAAPVPVARPLETAPVARPTIVAARAPLPSIVPAVAHRAAPGAPAAPHALALAGLDVEGSLSRAVVERAVARILPELHGCMAPAYVVAARLTIDDSRRATDLHVAGPRCVSDALAHLRTEVAPDIGDAVISLRFH